MLTSEDTIDAGFIAFNRARTGSRNVGDSIRQTSEEKGNECKSAHVGNHSIANLRTSVNKK